jgi:TPR repeat protein
LNATEAAACGRPARRPRSLGKALRSSGLSSASIHPSPPVLLGFPDAAFLDSVFLKSFLFPSMRISLASTGRALLAAFLLALLNMPALADLTALRKAANAGDVQAMRALVEQLGRSEDKKSIREGFDWVQKLGRDGGDIEALLAVARSYQEGIPAIDLAADPAEAEVWYIRAYERQPLEQLATMLSFYHSAALPNPKYVGKVLDQLQFSAENGNAAFQVLQARVLLTGQIVPKDQPAAVGWLRKAADQGNVEARHLLGSLLLEGLGTKQDLTEGAKLIVAAADAGFPDAAAYAGLLYRQGRGLPADPALSAQYFRRGMELGQTYAAMEYANVLAEGQGVPKDAATAVKLWEELSEQNPEAAYKAGMAYLRGTGVPQDFERAKFHLGVARDGKFAGADQALEKAERLTPATFDCQDDVALEETYAVRDGTGRYLQSYFYAGKKGDEVKVTVEGRITNRISLSRTDASHVRLFYAEPQGKLQGGDQSYTLKLKQDGMLRLVVTTRDPGQQADVSFRVAVTRQTGAGAPAEVVCRTGTNQRLGAGGYWNTRPVEQTDARKPVHLLVEADGFAPRLDAGYANQDGSNFSAQLSDTNADYGSAAELSYSQGSTGKFMIKISAVDGNSGGPYRLYIDRPLEWQERGKY